MMTPDAQKEFYDDLILAVKRASQTTPDAELSEFSGIMFAAVYTCYQTVFSDAEDARSRYLSALAIQMAMIASSSNQARETLEAALMVAKTAKPSSIPPTERNTERS